MTECNPERGKCSGMHRELNPAVRLSTFQDQCSSFVQCILIVWLLSFLLNQQVVSEYTQLHLQLWNGIRCAAHSTCYDWEKQTCTVNKVLRKHNNPRKQISEKLSSAWRWWLDCSGHDGHYSDYLNNTRLASRLCYVMIIVQEHVTI